MKDLKTKAKRVRNNRIHFAPFFTYFHILLDNPDKTHAATASTVTI